METIHQDAMVSVKVAADKSSVEMTVASSLIGQSCAESMCSLALQEQQISWSASVEKAVRELLGAKDSEDTPRTAVVARSTRPVHGVDGQVVWKCDQEHAASTAEPSTHQIEPMSFYQYSAYELVEVGQVIGTVSEPTAGVDGQNVIGAVLRAKAGKAAALVLDDTILKDAHGQLIAQCKGVLKREPGGKATIQKIMQIPGYVDFASGNVDFDGDVEIMKGIRDRFSVIATGNILVNGLIEAATVNCGGNLIVRSGIATRGIGSVTVKGDLCARYFSNANIQVHGKLKLEREAISSHIVTYGGIDAPNASIIGGEGIFNGKIEIGTLGSEAGVTTTLIFGRVPCIEQQQMQLHSLVTQLVEKQKRLLDEKAQISQPSASPNAQIRERQTELMFELDDLQNSLTRAKAAEATLEMRLQKLGALDLTVNKSIQPGVVIHFGEDRYAIHHVIPGPLRLHIKHGDATFELPNSKPRPLKEIADH